MSYHYKLHIRDIRLLNNAGIEVPVCKATAPLLDLKEGGWEFAKETKDATCQSCVKRYPLRYPWTREFRQRDL